MSLSVVVTWTQRPVRSPDCVSRQRVPKPGAPFPPQGPREASSPGSQVLWNAPTSAARSAALGYARRLPPVAPAFAPSDPTPIRGLELSGLAAPRQLADRGGRTLSSSQGVLRCLCPALGPRQDRYVRPYDAATRPPWC